MYWPEPDIKTNPERSWNRPDRVFFGFGACHILAGVFLDEAPMTEFFAEWIVPIQGYRGQHIYVTDGTVAFDYHGYARRDALLGDYWKGWQGRYAGWNATINRVQFSLLDTAALNARNHRGPDQYFGDPILRASRFLRSFSAPALG